MNRKKCLLILIIILLLTSCGNLNSTQEVKDTGEKGAEIKDENNASSPIEIENEDKPEEMIPQVLCGVMPFVNVDSGCDDYIDKVSALGGYEFDMPLELRQFSAIDLDQDGSLEAVVELTDGWDGWNLVLHEYEGKVYGYGYNYRDILSIYEDGTIEGSSGADSNSVYRLKFSGNNVTEIQTNVDTIELHEAEAFPFTNENIKKIWPNLSVDSVYTNQVRVAAQIAIQRTCTAAIKASEVLA